MALPCIKQHSEEDCGAACLASIAKHYGRTFAISRVREAVGTGQHGTSLLGLSRGAEALGFNARSVRTSPDILDRMSEAPLPAIIHWKGYHWVVLYGQRGKKYIVADPGVGIRYLSKKEVTEGWNDWVLLLLEPDYTRFSEQKDDDLGGIQRFLKRVLPYRGILLEAFFCALAVGILSLGHPILIQILTDDVLVRGDTKLLMAVVIAVCAMNLFSSSLRFVQSNIVAHFAQRLQLGFVFEFGRQILRLPLAYYEARRSGEIVSRLRDIQEINQFISQIVVGLPSQVFIGIVSFCFMLFYSWKLTVGAVIFGCLMSTTTFIFLPTLQRKVRNVLVLEAENQGILVESFKGALTLKTTTAAPQFWEEFQSRFSSLANQMLGTTQIGIVNSVFSGFMSDLGSICLLWFGSTLVIQDDLSIGQLLAFNSMNKNFLSLITTIVGFVDEFARVKTATQRLTEVIDATAEDEDDAEKATVELSGHADIVCEHLDFHYAGRVDLLHDFSVTIPGGKVVALVGTSGCGKSSLVKLLAGLYQPQSGNIRIGAFNLHDVALECLRKQVILVPQEPHFWSRSILENFRLGSPTLSLEQIVNACRVADADDFISKLPDKYRTVLGEFGANISGGQRQRLAIARAILNDPPILILDESTAGLDPVSEAKVLDQLLEHRQGKTTILISHRPRVVNRADWLILLDQGQLKTQGPLDQLYSQPGGHLDFLIEDSREVKRAQAIAHYKRGLQYLNYGNTSGAIADFSSAILFNSDYVQAYLSRGLTYCSIGEYDLALSDLNHVITQNCKCGDAYLGRALIFRKKGQLDAAIENSHIASQLLLRQDKLAGYKRAQKILSELNQRRSERKAMVSKPPLPKPGIPRLRQTTFLDSISIDPTVPDFSSSQWMEESRTPLSEDVPE